MAEPSLSAYDVAGHYDQRYFQDLADRYRRRNRFARQRIANVSALLPPLAGRRVLDLGCGMGTFTIEAARAGSRAVGLDLTQAAVAAARRVAELEGLREAAFVRGDAARVPIAEDSVDVVIAADVTEHLDPTTLQSMLGEAARVLRPGGSLVLYTPSPSHLLERLRARGILAQDPSHIGLRPAGELERALERAGLRIVRRSYLPSHLPGLKLVERALGRWVPLLRRRIGIVARKGEDRP